MKYIHVPALEQLSLAISNVDAGTCVINGIFEAYSCKSISDDKKLVRAISREYSDENIITQLQPRSHDLKELSRNLELARSTPLGNIQETQTQQLFADLMTTLNHAHHYYDYSNITPDQFYVETDFSEVCEVIDSRLQLLPANDPPIASILWSALDETLLGIRDCTIINFSEETSTAGQKWAEHYFFVNKNIKKLVYIFVEGISKLHSTEVISTRFAASPHLRPQNPIILKNNSSNINNNGAQAMELDQMEEIADLMPPPVQFNIIIDEIQRNRSSKKRKSPVEKEKKSPKRKKKKKGANGNDLNKEKEKQK